ncbi:tRNA A64-2'-O-ribosylphosphate transferase [Verticillium alfalfae VaMs.102]|uniref:tRNA A64-2'-O-ribosylphosphate transferase n=1 Tax=Verticillium alfalfae (strain VaMs.102 / ATCC MYA-4576 / FGSC 10136) TaxID=526221 RepID=C9S952_VERA1|nr:tRNA A64-2'-O-ribosylphosphate transferase [Verticillium alfalfae VaMs.102]EEY14100.1 tRNA A64-2'-O-ribosylphosphate transferase [Verticillium alfalfae VaMs.102]
MTSLSDIVFPSASEQPNLSHLLTELKRGDLSISNRLRSIIHDAEFVREVAAVFGSVEENPTGATETTTPSRPLVANERCGSWYIPPSTKSASAYFKSTDGHDNAWKFSTRRLNPHLLEIIGRCDGALGIPDALSKDNPNLVRRTQPRPLPHPSQKKPTPCTRHPKVVSPSGARPDHRPPPRPSSPHSWLSTSTWPPLRAQLPKPLRPLWITPDTPLLLPQTITTAAGPRSTVFEDAHPVVCCTASRRVAGGELREGGYVYVQGAGDDTENWACGLTAELFWAHVDQLLGTPEGELPALVRGLVDTCEPSRSAGAKKVAPSVAVSALAGVDDGKVRRCTVKLTPAVTEKETWIVKAPTEMEVGLGKHKVASRNLRTALPDICGFVTRFLESQKKEDGSLAEGTTVLVACETGKDLSVAVALAICLWCFDQQDNYRAPDTKTIFNKDMVRNRLGSIMTVYPEANPGRASLQSVNSFLMDYRR